MDADRAKPQMAFNWVHQVHSHIIMSFYWIEGVFHKPRYSAGTYPGMYIATVISYSYWKERMVLIPQHGGVGGHCSLQVGTFGK